MTDSRLTPKTGALGLTGEKATVKSIAEFWVKKPIYLLVFILATLGSLISGFVPGWGWAINAVCTIVATCTGFKAGVRYHIEITR